MVLVDPETAQTSEAGVSLEAPEAQASSLTESASSDLMPVVDAARSVVPEPDAETAMGFVRRQVSRMVSWFKGAAKGVSRMLSVNVPDDD